MNMGYLANERFEVPLYRLVQLEQAEKDLARARKTIEKLRTENKIHKQDKQTLISYGNKILLMWCKIGIRTKTFVPPAWAWNFDKQRQI